MCDNCAKRYGREVPTNSGCGAALAEAEERWRWALHVIADATPDGERSKEFAGRILAGAEKPDR